ncbi:hypothetical protein [Dipodfec virus UOA04_Rod_1087]|nr:hypothetical protein [Dipodfec virus UOA04_Rod_1087]
MIRSWLSYDPTDAEEFVDDVSMAVPDQTYSVRQLFERMAKGLSLSDSGLVHPVYYDNDEDIDNPDPTQDPAFDLADYSEQMDNLQDTIASRINSAKAEKRSEKAKADDNGIANVEQVVESEKRS